MKIDTSGVEKILKRKFTGMIWVAIVACLLCFSVGLNRGCAYGKAHPDKAAVQAVQ